MLKININQIYHDSIVDGPGLRTVIFTQGCEHKCPGCHNSATWSSREKQMMSIDEIVAEVKEYNISNKVTLSGGDPLMQYDGMLSLATKLKELGFNIWLYTGYTLEQVKARGNEEILNVIDVLVDGRYEQELHQYEESFIGSSNQKVHYLTDK